jgi:hypothetical protein
MTEKNILIESVNPLDVFGVNDSNFKILKKHFPKLKLIARGTEIKVIGDEAEIISFEKKFALLILHLERFGKLSEYDVNDLLSSESDYTPQDLQFGSDVLVHGRNGKLIKARTPNQQRMVDSCRRNDLIFAIGPPLKIISVSGLTSSYGLWMSMIIMNRAHQENPSSSPPNGSSKSFCRQIIASHLSLTFQLIILQSHSTTTLPSYYH